MNEELAGAKEILRKRDDEEMREMAEMEIAEIEENLEKAEEDLKFLLIPKDPNDEKNVILEIRAGTGGDEATLFAAEVLRMYARYAERQGWKMEILEMSETGVGGIKDAFASSKATRFIQKCVTNRAFTAFSAFRRPKLPDEFIRRRLPSPFCPKPKKLTCRSIKTISELIHFVRAVRAVNR